MKCHNSQLHLQKSEKSRHNAWDILRDSFFKNRIKNPYFFLQGTDSETGRIELSPDMHFLHVGRKTIERLTLWKKKKKFPKSQDFQDISKISVTNVHRLDTYLEKKSLKFLNSNFQGQKLFHGKSSFFDVCKKLDKKFVLLEKKGIVQKRKMSLIFRHQVCGNRMEIMILKFRLKKMGKKIDTCGIFCRFLRNFWKTCLLPLVADAQSTGTWICWKI